MFFAPGLAFFRDFPVFIFKTALFTLIQFLIFIFDNVNHVHGLYPGGRPRVPVAKLAVKFKIIIS